jgi:L-fucose isomerase-like protein
MAGNEKDVILEGNSFINNINLDIADHYDYFLKEDVKNSPVNFIFVETGGTEEKFLDQVFDKIPSPYYLISNGRNNSLPASLEIKTFCDERNVPCMLLTGNESRMAEIIEKIIQSAVTYDKLKNNNLGVIGKPSNWLIASKVDYNDIKERFGFNLIDISVEEFFLEIDKKTYNDFPRLEELKEKWKNKEVLEEALNIYGALKRLVNKYHLNGLTVRCFDLIDRYKNTSCLALSILNDEGITAGCEGDVPSLITMHIVSHLTSMPCFMANPSTIEFETDSIILSHCTIPLKLSRDYCLDTHFESGLGIGIRGKMKSGEISIVKICPDLSNVLDLVGEIKENLSMPNYCRTQIRVQINDGLKDFLTIPFGNHVIVSYGDILFEFMTYMEISSRKFEEYLNKK